ncbi:MAG: hypothetical protein OEY57_08330 [Nitrospirota bacterium]|nr:hypothetical protein [Nitrospirota bacterium]
MSRIKLGLLIFWPTFWTGFPIKMVFCLLLLAAHMPPWKGAGLFLLLLVSIPIDIWALGLCARTVFIDRLKVDSQPGIGMGLWLRWAVFSAIALPLMKIIVSATTGVAKSVTSSIVHAIKDGIYNIPVAEQISLELVMWGSVSTGVLILCLLGWLYGLGWLTQSFVNNAKSLDGTEEERANFWDSLRIPADQPLLLTAFTGAGVVLVFVFWALLPSTTPHPHEEYEFISKGLKEVKVEPQQVLKEAEKVLAKAELVVKKLEEEKGGESKDSKAEKAKEPAAKEAEPDKK